MMRTSGFTLIELSIALVIIGLIAGGILVGRDLISAAGVRVAKCFERPLHFFEFRLFVLFAHIRSPFEN